MGTYNDAALIIQPLPMQPCCPLRERVTIHRDLHQDFMESIRVIQVIPDEDNHVRPGGRSRPRGEAAF
jgi:hypothetical protein